MRTDRLNILSISEVLKEIGTTGANNLIKLAAWISAESPPQGTWEKDFDLAVGRFQTKRISRFYDSVVRLAPSLICRSEVELFGNSMPRFAMRFSFRNKMGFVNVRRLGSIGGQVKIQDPAGTYTLERLLEAPCVADAFLQQPSWMGDEWHLLKAHFGKACGEVEPGAADQLLTPYLRHMRPGGGLCAQAACFMSTSLHANLGAHVHGIPEVTAIAKEFTTNRFPERIDFEGLTTEELAGYFKSAENPALNSRWQAARLFRSNDIVPSLADANNKMVRELEHALRSYVLSDMPIIFPVDVGRMQGLGSNRKIQYYAPTWEEPNRTLFLDDPLDSADDIRSVFEKNGLVCYLKSSETDENQTPCFENRAHAVVIIGCERKPGGTTDTTWDTLGAEGEASESVGKRMEFAFNDPAHFPFMRASAHQLLLSACYGIRTNIAPNAETLSPPSESEDTLTQLSLGWFLPVTPQAVTLPLLTAPLDGTVGIKRISSALRKHGFTCAALGNAKFEKHFTLEATPEPEFRLLRGNRNELMDKLRNIYQARWQTAGNTSEILFSVDQQRELVEKLLPVEREGWVWLEVDEKKIFLWDAEADIGAAAQALVSSPIASSPASMSDASSSIANKILIAAGIWNDAGYIKVNTRDLNPRPAGPACRARVAMPITVNARAHTPAAAQVEIVNPLHVESNTPLKASLLTSFEVAGAWERVEGVASQATGLEIYTLMQHDAEKLLCLAGEERTLYGQIRSTLSKWFVGYPVYPTPNVRHTAMERMARYVDDNSKINKVARKFLADCKKCGCPPVGLATYLPSLCLGELGANGDPNPAIAATRFVIRVAGAIRALDPNYAPKIIEIVAGTRITGKVQGDENPYVVAATREIAISNLIESTQALLSDADDANVLLAFEYEPSTLCALGNVSSVETFCDRVLALAKEDPKWDRVGLNLDLAHWAFLGRQKPSMISESIKRLIKHAHISSHSCGHFGDAALENFGRDMLRKPEEYQEWLTFLRGLGPQFSGFVSLELECCKSRSFVETSLRVLNSWLT